MKCSVCLQTITSSGKVVSASCGHLVHAFKIDCTNSNVCSICQTNIEIFAHSPIIKLNFMSDDKPLDVKAEAMGEEEEPPKQEENKENGCVFEKLPAPSVIDEFIKNQFQMQREITYNLISLVRDQQSQIVSLVAMFTKFEKEFEDLKMTVDDLYDQESSDEGSDDDDGSCSCCKSDEVSPKKA